MAHELLQTRQADAPGMGQDENVAVAEPGTNVLFHSSGAIPPPEQDFQAQASPTAAAFDAPAPTKAAPSMGSKHVVKKGDTLWAISRRNGVSLKALIAANVEIKNPNLIFPGQVVKVPGKGKARQAPVVAAEGGEIDVGEAEVGETETEQADKDDDVIDQGDRGNEVAEVQQLLKATGYYHGNVGGNFGPGTKKALEKFQSDRSMEPTGVATDQTVELLRSAAKEAQANQPAEAAPAAGAASAIAYGQSVLGAPYAALNPYRFGETPWPGGSKVDIHGKSRGPYPEGTQVFDCSGFVVACWKHGGVNLLAHGLGDSRSVVYDKKFLQSITPDQLMPGDLIAWPGHIGMYYGNGQVIESTPNGGVKISDAQKFISHDGAVCKRVPA